MTKSPRMRSNSITRWPIGVAALLAACVPTLIAYNVSPSPTFLNQVAAVIGWGAVAAATGLVLRDLRWPRTCTNVLIALLLVVLSTAWAMTFSDLPASLGLSEAGMLFGAAALLLTGAASRQALAPERLFAMFALAWAVAASLSALVGIVQVFFPAWADGDWIARSGVAGRAVGNVRQPNHLSSVLLWGCISLVALTEVRPWRLWITAPLMALFVFGIALSGSRTGLIGVVLIALWAATDLGSAFWRLVRRRSTDDAAKECGGLSWQVRVLLIVTPILFAVSLAFLADLSQGGHEALGLESRLGESDISSSRFGIWSNAVALIERAPLYGVGAGDFNLAWTLTPFPHRPTAFFDHTHNLPLQLAVERGIPIALAVLTLLALALWRASTTHRGASTSIERTTAQCAFMTVLMSVVHSLVEYPLWYAYFLLPAAWAFGYCLGAVDRSRGPSSLRWGRALVAAGAALMIGGALAMVDYERVAAIFSPAEGAAPLGERIAAGRRSLLFAHHADYAAATTTDHPGQTMEELHSASHYLLDTRLMIAWSKAYAERGDLDRASYIAQRLREFHKPEAEEFFAPCADPAKAATAYQCQPPKRALTWRDFTRP